MTEDRHNRRQFLKVADAGALATAAGAGSSRAGGGGVYRRPGKIQFKLGLASYTLRKFKLDEALAMTKRVGLTHIAFKDFHLLIAV